MNFDDNNLQNFNNIKNNKNSIKSKTFKILTI